MEKYHVTVADMERLMASHEVTKWKRRFGPRLQEALDMLPQPPAGGMSTSEDDFKKVMLEVIGRISLPDDPI